MCHVYMYVHAYTVEYHLAIKMSEVLVHVTTRILKIC